MADEEEEQVIAEAVVVTSDMRAAERAIATAKEARRIFY